MDFVVTAGGALVERGRVLLGLRSREKKLAPGKWDIIGGHCEIDETPEQTLVREFTEEVGVVPRTFFRIASVDDPRPEAERSYLHHIYLVTEWDGEPANLGSEHTHIRWFTFSELRTIELSFEGYVELFESNLRPI